MWEGSKRRMGGNYHSLLLDTCTGNVECLIRVLLIWAQGWLYVYAVAMSRCRCRNVKYSWLRRSSVSWELDCAHSSFINSLLTFNSSQMEGFWKVGAPEKSVQRGGLSWFSVSWSLCNAKAEFELFQVAGKLLNGRVHFKVQFIAWKHEISLLKTRSAGTSVSTREPIDSDI